jgi:mannose-1-phosphate guanylyltransferase
LNRIEVKPTSIEKEIFPKMADEGKLFCMTLNGFWMDVGQPKDFLTGTSLYLHHVQHHDPSMLARGDGIRGATLIVKKLLFLLLFILVGFFPFWLFMLFFFF